MRRRRRAERTTCTNTRIIFKQSFSSFDCPCERDLFVCSDCQTTTTKQKTLQSKTNINGAVFEQLILLKRDRQRFGVWWLKQTDPKAETDKASHKMIRLKLLREEVIRFEMESSVFCRCLTGSSFLALERCSDSIPAMFSLSSCTTLP